MKRFSIPASTLLLLGFAALASGSGPAVAADDTASDSDEIVGSESGPIRVEQLAELTEPWGMAHLPDGRLLVTEKPGTLRVYSAGKLSEPIRGVPKVEYRGQGGLLDVAVDPDFATSSVVYLSYVEAAESQPDEDKLEADPRLGPYVDTSDTVVKGAAVARAVLDATSLRDVEVIWRQVPKTMGMGHFGGRLIFAADGSLFITSGERQRFEPAQDMTTNLGKIVRIHTDGSIPDDNPFLKDDEKRSDIWSSGHRNPLAGAIHPETGELWIHEMGPWHGDEINLPRPGANYGWPLVSNGDHYDGQPVPDHATRPDLAAPIYFWFPAVSPSGLTFYTGDRFPEWQGNVLLGGLSSQAVLRLTLDGNRVVGEERLQLRRRIRDVEQAPDGSVLVLTDAKQGALLRLTPASR